MKSSKQSLVPSLESAISAYVAAHPYAADSAVGISRWWLPTELGNCGLADIELALAALVVRRVLVERGMPDGSVVYMGASRDRNH